MKSIHLHIDQNMLLKSMIVIHVLKPVISFAFLKL